MLSPATPSAGIPRNAPDDERDFLRSHSFPLRSLRVRLYCSDPQALLPLSLPGGRWRTFARAHHRAASRRARVPFLLVRFADGIIAIACDGYGRRGRAGVVVRLQRVGEGGAPV